MVGGGAAGGHPVPTTCGERGECSAHVGELEGGRRLGFFQLLTSFPLQGLGCIREGREVGKQTIELSPTSGFSRRCAVLCERTELTLSGLDNILA